MMQYEDRFTTADRAVGDSSSAETLKWDDVVRLARHGNPPAPRLVAKTDAQWRALLTDEQFRIARLKGTERAHNSDMCRLFEPGRYQCLCCYTVLFDAAGKYQSHSGWPSFTQPVAPGVIVYHQDDSDGMRRIQTRCNVCDTHLGHVFPDGPEPSGLRFCINALSLQRAGGSSVSDDFRRRDGRATKGVFP